MVTNPSLSCTAVGHVATHLLACRSAHLQDVGDHVGIFHALLRPLQAKRTLACAAATHSFELAEVLHQQSKAVCETAAHDPLRVLLLQPKHGSQVCLRPHGFDLCVCVMGARQKKKNFPNNTTLPNESELLQRMGLSRCVRDRLEQADTHICLLHGSELEKNDVQWRWQTKALAL